MSHFTMILTLRLRKKFFLIIKYILKNNKKCLEFVVESNKTCFILIESIEAEITLFFPKNFIVNLPTEKKFTK